MTMDRLRKLPALWKQHPFHMHIAVLFTAMIFLFGAVLIWSNYHQGRAMVLSAAEDSFARIGHEAGAEMMQLRLPVEAVVDALSRAPITEAETLDARMRSIEAIVAILDRHPALESVYIGYYNGDFFQVHALRTEADRQRFGARRNAAYRLQSIERDKLRARYLLLDAALNVIAEKAPPMSERLFDPRTRPWYVASSDVVQTEPYVFYTTQEAGQTIARRASHGRAVVGADMTLSTLSAALGAARPTASSELALLDEHRRVIAYSQPMPALDRGGAGSAMLPKAAQLSPMLAVAEAGGEDAERGHTARVQGRNWLVRMVPAVQTTKGMTYLALAVPEDELLVAAHQAVRLNLWSALALLLLTVPIAWLLARRIAGNLNALTAQAQAIQRFDFRDPAPLATPIIEIRHLDVAMRRMRETIQRFSGITTEMAAERNYARLLRRVLDAIRDAAGAQGGVIYLLRDDGATLTPADQRWTADGAGNAPIPPLAMSDAAHPVVRAMTARARWITEVLPAGRAAGLAFLDERFGAQPVELVTLPLLGRGGTAIGAVCLFLGDATARVSPERLALMHAFAGAGAIAIDNQRLIDAQKALFESLITVIARAIDSKSPYTAAHCQRVPQLATMLARAACEEKSGPFADFDLDEEQWEALQVAAGLHDCGKVTTPEYVIDKATKLETIYDRIHEVRMRFEVLKRDAQIACLEAVAGGGDEQRLRTELAATLRALDEEFAFVASCNHGSEYMAPAKLDRLNAIAQRTWQRTLDDRLGVSWAELQRAERTPPEPLPATERVLADKPWHVIERPASERIDPDNPWGFKLAVPRALYNRGELYNLSIARGTLNEEERYKINDHIVQTIVMLSALPFPKHLQSVPEIAGGHHEKMDGTGYPKQLRGEDMSVPARIMAIADVFEALTAPDRPYKKGKTLSEAIRIMARMARERHLDAELFRLFLRSGIYREYAGQHMNPENVDAVNLDEFLDRPVERDGVPA